MARKPKTYQTSVGFYDLAIAAPSMKAALEAWGAGSNLFHQGIATETDDPDVVAATMAKPGVVLKRAAGSNSRFAEHAGLPTGLGEPPSGAEAATGSQDQRQGRPQGPRRTSTASRSAARPSAAMKRRRGRRTAPNARSWSRRRRPRWTRRRESTKSGPRPSRPNGQRSRSGLRPKRPGGRARRSG